ncbi:hypothetical protein, partial [Streptomyces galilaeus]|uniref:hypothetical protein n=1 Tax=Streptomyces galilaeus TaxID=33899 RepID=UPI0038F74BAD
MKRGDLSKEELAQFINVPEEALPDEDHEFPDWVVGLQKRNKLVKTRKTERYLSSKTKQKLRSVNRQSQQEAEELAK